MESTPKRSISPQRLSLIHIFDSSDKVGEYFNECRECGIKLLPPDVNHSADRFTVEPEGIRFGLVAIKNIGRGLILRMMQEREMCIRDRYFLRAESFYNVATKEIDYSDDDHPSKGYHQKSHGESFLAIAQDYMGADGVYIFDEPEAALSPQRQLTLLINIYRCAQEGAQFIIVSHSPILLGMPDAEIFSFDNGTIHPCQYEDTDSYVITKTFVNNRQHFLNQLLNEET